MQQRALLLSISSDSHTWNLVYMQLLLGELGFDVVTAGCCVTPDELVELAHYKRPDLIVISTINGHGYVEAKLYVSHLKKHELVKHIPIVIGGNLTINGNLTAVQKKELIALGFAGVFTGKSSIEKFKDFVSLLRQKQTIEHVAAEAL